MVFGMIFSGAVEETVGWAWTMTAYALICFTFTIAIVVLKLTEVTKCMSSATNDYSNLDEDSERQSLSKDLFDNINRQ